MLLLGLVALAPRGVLAQSSSALVINNGQELVATYTLGTGIVTFQGSANVTGTDPLYFNGGQLDSLEDFKDLSTAPISFDLSQGAGFSGDFLASQDTTGALAQKFTGTLFTLAVTDDSSFNAGGTFSGIFIFSGGAASDSFGELTRAKFTANVASPGPGPASVPEPSSLSVLALAGLLTTGLIWKARRQTVNRTTTE